MVAVRRDDWDTLGQRGSRGCRNRRRLCVSSSHVHTYVTHTRHTCTHVTHMYTRHTHVHTRHTYTYVTHVQTRHTHVTLTRYTHVTHTCHILTHHTHTHVTRNEDFPSPPPHLTPSPSFIFPTPSFSSVWGPRRDCTGVRVCIQKGDDVTWCQCR